MPAPTDSVLSNRKSRHSQRVSMPNMRLRHSPNSVRDTSDRDDRASDRDDDRHDDRRDPRGHDRRTWAWETARQQLPRK